MDERVSFESLPLPGFFVLGVQGSQRNWTYVHERVCVTIVHDGTGRWRMNGRCHDITPSSLMVMAPGDVHVTTDVCTPGTFDALFIDPDVLNRWFEDSVPRRQAGRLVLQSSVTCAAAFQAFSGSLRDPCVRAEPEALAEGLLRAASLLLRLSPQNRVEAGPACDVRLQKARDCIHDRYGAAPSERVSIQQIARELGVDYYWLERRFAEFFHVTPYQYAKNLRAARARELILGGPSDDLPTLTAVAERAGFYDYPHLNRELPRHVGMSPMDLALQVGGWPPQRARGRR